MLCQSALSPQAKPSRGHTLPRDAIWARGLAHDRGCANSREQDVPGSRDAISHCSLDG